MHAAHRRARRRQILLGEFASTVLGRIAFVEPGIRTGPGAQALGAFEECFARDSRIEQCGLEFFELS